MAYKHIADERMMAVAAYVVSHQIRDISTVKAWCEAVGISPNNISNIKSGKQSFSTDHILTCCTRFNIDANFIFGLSNKMLRKEPANPIDKLKAAVIEVERAMKKK